MRELSIQQLGPTREVLDELELPYMESDETLVQGGDILAELKANTNFPKTSDDLKRMYNEISFKPIKLPRFKTGLFPEDTIFTLRAKISAAFGIPLYRIFMFTEKQKFARVITGIGKEVDVDISKIFDVDFANVNNTNSGTLFGCLLDQDLVKAAGFVIVKNKECFKTLSDGGLVEGTDTIYIADLADWLVPIWDRLANSSQTQQDYWYYGFVSKYWHLLPKEMYEYLVSGRENMINEEVPEMERQINLVSSQYPILKRIHSKMTTKKANAVYDSFRIAITNAIIMIPNPQAKIDLSEMFNYIGTNMTIPVTSLVPPATDMSFIKTFPNAEVFEYVTNIKLPAEFKQGIIIGMWINLGPVLNVVAAKQMIFININPQSVMRIYTRWREDYKIDFEKHLMIMNKFVNPFIDKINEYYGYFMFNKINRVEVDTMRYEILTIMLYWPSMISDTQFAELKKNITNDVGNGIFEYNNFSNITAKDAINLDFVKGISHRDPDLITYQAPRDNFNYYSWLWSPAISKKWQQLYRGFSTKMIHRSNDLRIEMSNLSLSALELFKRYMSVYLSAIDTGESGELKKYKRKIVKLNHNDPVLFKFLKEDEKGKKQNYSIQCQEKKQPIIYNTDEFELMSDSKRKKLVQYWNYTYNRDAYYECPSAEFPHLGFLIGKHPQGFCLPCCQKLDPSHKPEYSECMKHDLESKIEKTNKSTRHIMIYKDVPIELDRLSQVPQLNKFFSLSNVYLIGVTQTMRGVGRIGLLESILLLLNENLVTFLKKIQPTITDAILWRDIYELFYKKNTMHTFRSTVQELNEAWIDAVSSVYDLNIVIINLQKMIVRTGLNISTENLVIVAKSDDIFEPVVQIDLEAYFSAVDTKKIKVRETITRRTFTAKQLGSILEKAVVRRGIDFTKIKSKPVSAVSFTGDVANILGFIMDNGVYLPKEFVPEAPTTLPITNEVNGLSWPKLRDQLSAMGILISYGVVAEEKIKVVVDRLQRMYFVDIALSDFELPVGDRWHYPIKDVLGAIYNQQLASVEKPILEDLNNAEAKQLYKQTIFRHLVYLFILVLNRFQNRQLRKEIMDHIIKKDMALSQMKISQADIEVLIRLTGKYHSMISRGQYAIVEQAINDQRFQFDEIFLDALRQLSYDDMKKRIMSMLDPFIKIDSSVESPNLVIFHSLDFYEDKPLILHSSEYLELLFKWFRNPMLKKYFTSASFSNIFEQELKNIDFTKFVLRPGERLEIKINENIGESEDGAL